MDQDSLCKATLATSFFQSVKSFKQHKKQESDKLKTMKHLKSFQSLIKVPSNVKCELKHGHLLFSGPLGSSFLSFTGRLSLTVGNKSVFDCGKVCLLGDRKQFEHLRPSLVQAKSAENRRDLLLEKAKGLVVVRDCLACSANQVCSTSSAKSTRRAKSADTQSVSSNKLVEKEEIENSNSQTLCLSFKDKSMLETFKKLISNRLHGVRFGFTLYLRVVGVGYRVSYKFQNHRLIFKVGLSHDVEFQLPPSIRVFVLEPTLFCLFGINKNQVTQVGAKIRMIRPPEVYKGKGIRLVEEKIKLIQGKRK